MKRWIPVGDLRIGEEERQAVIDVLESGRISEGRKLIEFEKKFSDYVGTKYCIGVSSGTSALLCALTALKTIYGENKPYIVTTPLTFIATVNSIVLTGHKPIFVDISLETFNITPENIKEAVENKPDEIQAILPVHLMGYPCEIIDLIPYLKENNIPIIEDSSQAHGSLYHDGTKTGSKGLCGTFSFYVAHNIQAGEMGAITTSDEEFWRICRKVKAHGRACDCAICTRSKGTCPKLTENMDPRFTHEIIGYNFKLMDFAPALAIVQLKKADEIIAKRRENVKYLNDCLSQFSDILKLPKLNPNVSYLAYPLILNPEKTTRAKFQKMLEAEGIESRPIFGCIPTQQPAYSHMKKEWEGKLPNAEFVGKNGFYIGCHQYLDEDDLNYIVDVFKRVISSLM
ncbi:MAG: DegT/DnrJ/EryC1/StrS aminotransferase family protein [Thermoplasmata archaeon]